MAKRTRGNVNAEVQRDLLRFNMDLFRVEAGARRKIVRTLEGMHVELLAKLSERDLTKFTKERLRTLLRETEAVIEGYYAQAQATTEQALEGVSELQATHTAR